MWSRSYSTTVEGLDASRLWDVWTDVNQWHTWQDDLEYARLDGAFTKGNVCHFRPREVRASAQLIEVIPNTVFVDLTRFPLARMYDSHELVDHGDKVEIRRRSKSRVPCPSCGGGSSPRTSPRSQAQTEKLIEEARSV